MKCTAHVFTDNGKKLCRIECQTNLDNSIKNENRIHFEECVLDVIEFNRISEIYRNIARII